MEMGIGSGVDRSVKGHVVTALLLVLPALLLQHVCQSAVPSTVNTASFTNR